MSIRSERLRRAIEATGRTVEAVEWEPLYVAGEMQGLGGGWRAVNLAPPTFPDALRRVAVEEWLGCSLGEALYYVAGWDHVEATP